MCIWNNNGKPVKEMKVRGHWVEVVKLLEEYRSHRLAVCYEASCG